MFLRVQPALVVIHLDDPDPVYPKWNEIEQEEATVPFGLWLPTRRHSISTGQSQDASCNMNEGLWSLHCFPNELWRAVKFCGNRDLQFAVPSVPVEPLDTYPPSVRV